MHRQREIESGREREGRETYRDGGRGNREREI